MIRLVQRRYFDTFKIKEFSSLDLPIQPVSKLIPSKSSAVTSHWKWKRKKVSYQKIEENNFFSAISMIDGRVSLVRMSTGEIIDKFNDKSNNNNNNSNDDNNNNDNNDKIGWETIFWYI